MSNFKCAAWLSGFALASYARRLRFKSHLKQFVFAWLFFDKNWFFENFHSKCFEIASNDSPCSKTIKYVKNNHFIGFFELSPLLANFTEPCDCFRAFVKFDLSFFCYVCKNIKITRFRCFLHCDWLLHDRRTQACINQSHHW